MEFYKCRTKQDADERHLVWYSHERYHNYRANILFKRRIFRA